MMRRPTWIFAFLLFVLMCIPTFAQTVDTAILGTVSDNSGAIISGAVVTLTFPATGFEKKAVTTSTGEYRVAYLTPGNYDLTVSAVGFAAYEQKGIVLPADGGGRIHATAAAD